MIKYERTNVYDFNFHLVWVTKYRKPVFTSPEKCSALKDILSDIAQRHTIEVSSLEIMPDHVHMIVSFAPKYAPSSIVKAFKGGSAKQWFKQFPETKQQLWGGHLWSPSFFMSTLGNVSKEIVTQYIDSQLDQYNGGRPRR
ncbi:IS200/IS605 family transposase [Levilactobacillus hammesii]|uniref:Transposase n=1 Tax=Levilactobacillus hammesii DSM 16381 TaxID=1423753 RepID=A0A0R1UJ68_9LACO|nr:IS200/IS605 family transposase [Levilactobacillus hammesii]KRL93372.1 transposase [Levilactobacillus hammesii DSM 16381]